MALGINQIAGISGSFIGLVLGGVLAPIQWRLIFLVSVPIGLFGTVWAYRKLKEIPRTPTARIDWPGNVTFALGLIAIMVGHHLRDPALRRSPMGWLSPLVLARSSAASRALLLHPVERARPTRCSGCRSFGSGPSAPAASRASSRRSDAAD
jgi:MFS family permease